MSARLPSTIRLLMLLFVAAIPPQVLAADVNPAGDWTVAVNLPDGGALNMSVHLEEKDGKLAGTLTGDDGVETELSDIELDGDKLTFKLVRDFGGQELKSTFSGKLSEKSFEGTVDYELGADAGTLDVTGERVAKVDLNGLWLLVATSDGGVFEPKLDLKHEGDAVSGKYTWTEEVVAELKDGKVVDGEVTFTVTHDFDGQDITVIYKLKPDGEKLVGTADYDFQGQTGTATIEGSKAGALAGKWNIKLVGPNGDTMDATATLTQDGEVVAGEYTGPAGDAKISDGKLNGDSVTFKVVRERDGQELTLTYKGKLEGNKLAGDVEYDFGGQTGETTFEAEKAE